MNLIRAKSESDWSLVSEMLSQIIEHLDSIGKSLWKYKQAEVAELKKLYSLDEIYFLCGATEIYGMVILQRRDPLFWPEIHEEDSYFVHKLAVLPKFKGLGCGHKILNLVVELARVNGIKYLRLDCDPRRELISFYQDYGFSFVAKLLVGEFTVFKYELLVGRG